MILQSMKQEKMIAHRPMKKARDKGKRGGSGRWEFWVVQLICELLVIGIPPTSIPESIATVYETLYGFSPEQVPSINFIRYCRTVVQVIGETIAAIKLGRADVYKQLFTDATSRRQTPFQALIIGLMGEDFELDPVIVSSCIFLDDERAETVAAAIVDKVRCCAVRCCSYCFATSYTHILYAAG